MSSISVLASGASSNQLTLYRTPAIGSQDRYSSTLHEPLALITFEYLDETDLNTAIKVNVAWYRFSQNKTGAFKNMFITRLLPGITREQLGSIQNTSWEETYKNISRLVYGPTFFRSIGVRTSPVDPIPQSLLEKQYLPLVAYPTNLEIDVPVGSPLQATEQGVLIDGHGSENAPAVNEKRTVSFLNTPHNWLILAAPIPTDPTREASPDNPYIAKYLNRNAQPVRTEYVSDLIKGIWDTPPAAEWKAPAPTLVALGQTYDQSVAEAQTLGLHSLTFPQDSIHRILGQIKGNPDPYPDQFSRTSTSIGNYKAGTYVYSATVALVAPARVRLYVNVAYDDVGLAAARGPAGSR